MVCDFPFLLKLILSLACNVLKSGLCLLFSFITALVDSLNYQRHQ
ncbi:hypothetical protein JCM19300_3003 [Algibacter lectus]|uniref:Uncharacterized protein n=1 Tax=Algibacter lectus TaxID=221126 RepID=A0A090W401_9FLAO|nr:hypothetical protein JCM19300_3003 [Algibacter lectus]